MSDNQELIIFTGNIGCGKSLIASKLAKNNYVIVNNDAITTMIQGGEYGLYDPAKKPIYHHVEGMAIVKSLALGFSVVVDRTNMKISDREKYIDIGKLASVPIRSFDWGSGLEITLARRIAKPNGIPEETWESVHKFMHDSYEAPSLNEGFNAVQAMGFRRFKFYAFDFDGTIVEKAFPEIGHTRERIIKRMHEIWEDLNNIIIIWTCRGGNKLNQMRNFLLKDKIPFDFINENPLVNFGSPKIFAHEYFDDRNDRTLSGN